MFVLLSVAVCCLCYLISVNVIYKRYKRSWIRILQNLSPGLCADGEREFLFTYSESEFPSQRNVRVLLVTAHPDDECMFFSPVLLKLTQSHADVHLLCLSTGTSYSKRYSLYCVSACHLHDTSYMVQPVLCCFIEIPYTQYCTISQKYIALLSLYYDRFITTKWMYGRNAISNLIL